MKGCSSRSAGFGGGFGSEVDKKGEMVDLPYLLAAVLSGIDDEFEEEALIDDTEGECGSCIELVLRVRFCCG